MKIGIDIDGVILDFERTMRSYAELYDFLILKKEGVKDFKKFDYLKRYNWTDEEKQRFVDNYLTYATTNALQIDGLSSIIKSISNSLHLRTLSLIPQYILSVEIW